MRFVERFRPASLLTLSHRLRSRVAPAVLALAVGALLAPGTTVRAADDADIHSFLMSSGSAPAQRGYRAPARAARPAVPRPVVQRQVVQRPVAQRWPVSHARPVAKARPVPRTVASRTEAPSRPAHDPRIKYASLPRGEVRVRGAVPTSPSRPKARSAKDTPDYLAALMRDPTLRRGDIVMLPSGPHVFRGAARPVHTLKDFAAVPAAKIFPVAARRAAAPKTKSARLAD